MSVEPDRAEDGFTSWDVGAFTVVVDRTGPYPEIYVENEGECFMTLDKFTARSLGAALQAAVEATA